MRSVRRFLPTVSCCCYLLTCALLAAAERGRHAAIIGQWDAGSVRGARAVDLSGNKNDAVLHDVPVMTRTEALGERASFTLDGRGGHLEVTNNPGLNPPEITMTVWFKPKEGAVSTQKALVLKSAPRHAGPAYQYGLFLMDTPDRPRSVAFYLSVGGQMQHLGACNAFRPSAWNCTTATYDGRTMRLYCNGKEAAARQTPPGRIDLYGTPLLFGAYGNLPKGEMYCFAGNISSIILRETALSEKEVLALWNPRGEQMDRIVHFAPTQ